MIEDVFLKRYRNSRLLHGGLPHNVSRALNQAAHIFYQDVAVPMMLADDVFLLAQNQLCREVGGLVFQPSSDPARQTYEFLCEPWSVWDRSPQCDPDLFLKLRLSIIELLFRYVEQRQLKVYLSRGRAARREEVLPPAIRELNVRFRDAELPFHYHNGVLQFVNDELTEHRITEPFWQITSDPKWANVDEDMKEAVDRFDNNGRDPALYASKALESTIKIISGEKGWTRGNEKGAANYIDNLVSHSNGRFIDVWERDALKAIFSHVRNPHGHGPGSAPQPALSPSQTAWAIETCMSWIKNLIRRL